MPLRGEATARPTYLNHQRLKNGSQLLHRCEHAVLGKYCAQKTVRIAGSSVVSSEPRLLEELDHPHIPPVREAQFDPEYPDFVTFVMPWYDGGSIAGALLEGHRFSIGKSLGVMRDVLDALEYVHTRKGYVHRDIKTDNVLLNADRTAGYLTDFGLAALLEQGGDAPATVATYEYMAPECSTSLRHGPRSDIYGVGMVLFEMLNGRLPWESLDRATAEKRVLSGRRALPDATFAASAFSPHVPSDLVRVTRKAIAKDPARRYGSAAEMLAAINGITFIDWRRIDDNGVEGTWEGGWPPHDRSALQDQYQVTTQMMTRGPAAGSLRVVAAYRRAGASAWRRIGSACRDITPTDASALRSVFAEVSANAAQRRAAR